MPVGALRKTCTGCWAFNDPSSGFCVKCGAQLPAEASVPAYGEPAGFWIRAVAVMVDSIPLAIVESLVEGRLGILPDSAVDMRGGELLMHLAGSFFVTMLIYGIYTSVMLGTWGATIGKMIVGLRVVRSDGGRVTYGIALTRSVAELASALVFGLGYLWVALSPSKRAWHDYLCDTRVVYKRPS